MNDIDAGPSRAPDFAALFEGAASPLLVLDPGLRVVAANRAYGEAMRMSPARLIGRALVEAMPAAEGADGLAASLARVLASRLPESLPPQSYIIPRSEGRGVDQRQWRLSSTPILGPDDDVKWILHQLEDVTDRVSIEAQMRQSQKMEAIGILTGGLAHDFNNLLSVVIGNIDLLRETLSAEPDADALAEEALSAALKGADLTKRLLAFARRQPLQPRQVDLNAFVAGVEPLLARTAGETFAIRRRLGASVWPVSADPAQLEACLVNLVTNARDAMPSGGELLLTTDNRHLDADYASMHAGLVPGDYAFIEVTDTGTGMAPGTLERIFEPFFTTKEAGKGTGLGLSMVFGFMKQSGGHISVYSEPGMGTTLRLYLPRAGEAVSVEETSVARATRGGPETVLAVEDNPALRDLVVRQLKQLGYLCLEAGDGPSALEILETQRIDLLFTDVIMPGGMSGYDLARQTQSRWPAVKVLLTSGFPEEKLNGNRTPPPNVRLLNKPYRKQDLARIVREVLDS